MGFRRENIFFTGWTGFSLGWTTESGTEIADLVF